MATHFPTITERRYALYPRRYSNEYHFERHSPNPSAKGACATLVSARQGALRALDIYRFAVCRIFDRLKGEYAMTYVRGRDGTITPHEGYHK